MGHAMQSRFQTVEENYFNRLQLHHTHPAGRPRLAGRLRSRFKRFGAELWAELAPTLELMHRSGLRWPPFLI
jgi:hypothetical protein